MLTTGYIQTLPPTPQGWQCPCCKMVYAPSVESCDCQTTKSSVTTTPPWGGVGTFTVTDCGCPTNGACWNTACPRATKITYNTTATTAHPGVPCTNTM